jgi:hypothetical protein
MPAFMRPLCRLVDRRQLDTKTVGINDEEIVARRALHTFDAGGSCRHAEPIRIPVLHTDTEAIDTSWHVAPLQDN